MRVDYFDKIIFLYVYLTDLDVSSKIKVLFVCSGNICRSPLVEGIFNSILKQKKLLDLFLVDSAAINNYHVGSIPDERAIQAAAEIGVTLNHCARQFELEDFNKFDYILVMDHLNYEAVITLALDPNYHDKVFLFRTFDSLAKDFYDVPDPYYGSAEDFLEVRGIAIRAADGFLSFLQANYKL